jgi:hypothetical protein
MRAVEEVTQARALVVYFRNINANTNGAPTTFGAQLPQQLTMPTTACRLHNQVNRGVVT